MTETNLNNDFDDDVEFKKLMWEQLTNQEKTVMKFYSNIINNNKPVNTKMMDSVNEIMNRYPDFDVSCVP